MKDIMLGLIGAILGVSLCVNGLFVYKTLFYEEPPKTETVAQSQPVTVQSAPVQAPVQAQTETPAYDNSVMNLYRADGNPNKADYETAINDAPIVAQANTLSDSYILNDGMYMSNVGEMGEIFYGETKGVAYEIKNISLNKFYTEDQDVAMGFGIEPNKEYAMLSAAFSAVNNDDERRDFHIQDAYIIANNGQRIESQYIFGLNQGIDYMPHERKDGGWFFIVPVDELDILRDVTLYFPNIWDGDINEEYTYANFHIVV